MGDGMMGGKSPDDEDEGDESMGKQARLTMVKTMMQAVKDDDAESFKTALEDFIAAS